jgi:hypothetical protein
VSRHLADIERAISSGLGVALGHSRAYASVTLCGTLLPLSRLFGNRWLPLARVRIAPDAQAIFCRRRHQPRRPPLAKIRPGILFGLARGGTGTIVGTNE